MLRNQGLLLAGTALLLVGFAFKVAAVPFHVWSPDVYEGSPTPVVGFMAAIAKVGAFAAVLRVQRNVKRMLAYSSISHAGFVLLALWAASPRGTAAALYYLAAYSLLVIGSFAVVTIVSSDGREDLTSYRGLAQRRPLLAASFTVLLLAQAGVPFTTGFLAKLAVIESAIEHLGAPGVALGVVAMLATAISGYFYLPPRARRRPRRGPPPGWPRSARGSSWRTTATGRPPTTPQSTGRSSGTTTRRSRSPRRSRSRPASCRPSSSVSGRARSST